MWEALSESITPTARSRWQQVTKEFFRRAEAGANFASMSRLQRIASHRWGIIILAACISVLVLAGCARKKSHALVVGMELSSPPFEMTDEHNQPTGIGVDMARALAAYLHQDLVIENTKFEGLIPALQTGRIDLIISSMTATDERARTIDFSDPYVRISICLLVGANSGLHAGGDLNQPGRRLVVKNGTTGADYARDHLGQATVYQIADESACVLEVIQGKADAFIYDQMSVYQLHQRNPATTRAVFQPLQRENWAIGIGKKHEELRRGVNAFLADFRAKQGLEHIAGKYLSDRDALKEMGDPFSF